MKYFVVFLFFLSLHTFAQTTVRTDKVSATVLNDNDSKPLSNVNILNLNSVRGATTNDKGYFEIDVRVNDTLHLSIVGFQSLRVKVTNDWIKSKNTQIRTEKAP